MSTLFDLLSARQGNYRGQGMNHEGESFEGLLQVRSAFAPGALCWDFFARVPGGLIVHGEHTLLAPDETGAPGLWTVSNNRPHVARYAVGELVRQEADHVVAFTDGDPDDESRFRSRIRLEVLADGGVGYHHAWGLPGGPFAERSGVRMTRGD